MNFKPAWWLKNPHLQTIYTTTLRKIPVVPGIRRERLNTPDQDFIDIDWCGEDDEAGGAGSAIVILLHGLAGSGESGYIKGLQKIFLEHGLRSATLNFRGCSGEMNRLARGYHSGDTGDIDFLYQTIRRREPNTQIAVVGFSLGGNVLLKWLGEQGNKLDIQAAVAVSVPLLLADCASQLDRGISKIYRDYLIKALIAYMSAKHEHLVAIGAKQEAEKISRLGSLSGITSFWQYDDRIVAPLHGFRDVNDYYQRSSSRPFLKNIQIPTLVIQAYDDPFMTPNVLPETDELSDSVDLQVTRFGGHVGFIQGKNPWKPEFWLEKRINSYLSSQISL